MSNHHKRVHFDLEMNDNANQNQPIWKGGGHGHLEVPPPSQPYMKLPLLDTDEEWMYNMRREMQEILPGLYLGPYASASKAKLESLQQSGITDIIIVRHFSEQSVLRPVHEGIKYFIVEMGDDGLTCLIPHIKHVKEVIDECLAAGRRVLVHGNAGMNKSASLVIGYVMATFGVGLVQALDFVRYKRFCTSPSEPFIKHLREYEAIYQAVHTTPSESKLGTRNKRNIDELSDDNLDSEPNVMEQ